MEVREEEGKREKEKAEMNLDFNPRPWFLPFFFPLHKVPYSPFKGCKQFNPFSGLKLVGSVFLSTACNWNNVILYIFVFPVDFKCLE